MTPRADARLVALLGVVLVVASLAPAGAADAGSAGTVDAGTAQVAACAFPVERVDATGESVVVATDPDRLVALHPSAAQTLWEIGAREEVVGLPVNAYTADLEGARDHANVVGADGYTVDVERVVALEPDLVLAPNVTPTDTVERLRAAGLPVYHFRAAGSVEDVVAKTLLTGRLTGHCDGAAATAAWMRSRIGAVRAAVAGEDRPPVLYPLGGGVVAGAGTFVHELVTTAGGENLAASAGVTGYGQLSAEVVVARDPEWLVVNDDLPASAMRTDAYNRTTAVRTGQIVRVNANYANQPAPRVVHPIERLARALHPEAMARADDPATSTPPGTTAAGGPTPTPSADAGETTVTTTRSPGQPGFGPAIGLLAIALVVIAGTRRRSG